MIAAGRKNEVDRINEHVATIVPGASPEPLVECSRAECAAQELLAGDVRLDAVNQHLAAVWGNAVVVR